jgi:chloramphenicol-sensitive protein RarD
MATLGILQYISPSIQMLVGVFLYGEAFDTVRALGFYLIWLALAIYSLDSLWSARKRQET